MRTKNIFNSAIFILILFFLSNCKENTSEPEPIANISKPTVITSDITAITQVSATSGGNITSDGGAAVTERGVCWSILPMPTITDFKMSNGKGEGSFSVDIKNLNLGTKYYIRAFATNSKGTSYGEEKSFTTDATLAFGVPYAGGIIYYLDSTGKHGLVCADTVLGEATWGCNNKALTGALGTTIGTGAQNTLDILSGCSDFMNAADRCSKLKHNGYTDWFLPSRDELIPIHFNLKVKGLGNIVTGHYWTSTQTKLDKATYAETIRVGDDGGQQNGGKNNFTKVIAVRAF